MKTERFKRGDTAYWPPKNPNQLRSLSVVETYDFKEAVRVRDSKAEWVVTDKDIITQHELEMAVKKLAEEKKTNARIELYHVIRMWHAGIKTPVGMAQETQDWPIKFVSQIAAAKRWGFIE